MNFLNAQQLAFILDIKKEDARAKMCNAWCKEKGIPKDGSRIHGAERERLSKKIKDPYPLAMPVEILAKHLNLPNLQDMVDDIVNNYLTRPASKKWILCDYPEKQIKKAEESGVPKKVSLPPALRSLLPQETQNKIYNEWGTRFKKDKIIL